MIYGGGFQESRGFICFLSIKKTSNRASLLGDSLVTGAQTVKSNVGRVGGAVSKGTHSMVHTVASGTKSAAGFFLFYKERRVING